MKQIAGIWLTPTMAFLGMRFLIIDRDPVFTNEFRAMLKAKGVEPLILPPGSPNLNAFAERFVLSIRSECLDRIVPLGEAHLRRTLSQFLAGHHSERNHKDLHNSLINAGFMPTNTNGAILKHERLGGLLDFHDRGVA